MTAETKGLIIVIPKIAINTILSQFDPLSTLTTLLNTTRLNVIYLL
jgi:hypothetical protein